MKKTIFIIFLVILSITLTGCFIKIKSKQSTNDGGIYKSIDKGESWTRKILIPTTSSEKPTIERVNTYKLIFDPQDYKALYLLSFEHGLYFTYDEGENWNHVDEFGNSKINALAIDPNSSCIIYTAVQNRLYKSTDCSRNWKNIYVDTRAETELKSLAVDFYDSTVVYMGTSSGELLQSTNSGEDWHTIKRFDNPIEKIVINPQDTRIFYVATAQKGIYKTEDKGENWKDLNKALKKYRDSFIFRDLIIDINSPDTLFHLSRYGILKSEDGGESFKALKLITRGSEVDIFALGINMLNTDEIYYGTTNTFYKSSDGGKTWKTKRLPTSRAINALLVNPEKPNIIYIGVKSLK